MPRMNNRNMAPAKITDFGGTIKKLVKSLAPYKFIILGIIIFAMGSTVFSIVGPKIMGNATTEIFNGLISKLSGGAGINFANILKILIMLAILYVASAIFSYILDGSCWTKIYL